MLKQEPVDEQNPSEPHQAPRPPASGAPRVTPEELNAALAAIEARREADAKTIPLDQAVSDLNLDSTPDEIWTEVQAQRAKIEAQRAKAAAEREQQAQHTPPRPVTAAEDAPMRLRRGTQRRSFIPLLIVGGIILLSSHNHIPYFGSHHAAVVSTSAVPILRPLAQVPADVEVYADASALAQISAGKPFAQITVSENTSGNRWTIVKRGGHVYLRGYIARADSLQAIQNQPLTVYSGNDSGELDGESTSNVTLRVDKTPLSNPGGGNDYLSVTIPNFQPDPLTTLDPGS